MTQLEKGMLVLSSFGTPLGCLSKICYAGYGQGVLLGKTLFDVFIDNVYYGFFSLSGTITTLEEAQARLSLPAFKEAEETVAQHAICYQFLHVDDNDSYGGD